MKIDGGCHCGAIRYEAEVDPERAGICHCTDCQTLSGSAFRTIVFTLPGGFELLSGAPGVYVKTGDSGNRRQQAFCTRCGTPIYSASPEPEPRVYSIRLGTVRQRSKLAPKYQLWHRSAQTWIEGLHSIPAVEKQ